MTHFTDDIEGNVKMKVFLSFLNIHEPQTEIKSEQYRDFLFTLGSSADELHGKHTETGTFKLTTLD